MGCLDFDRLDAVDAEAFQSQKPFPFANPERLLSDAGYQRLLASLPNVAMFDDDFGRERKFGQECHDRYNLEYREGLDISQPWQEFIGELRGERYRAFLARLFGTGSFGLRFHWHYAPSGCWVSPHCDSKRKLGSHLFYLNSSQDWDPSWGGQTVALDDGGRFPHNSSPAIEDFEGAVEADCLDNKSFIFRRTPHSWHYVKRVSCPKDFLRKVFIVVVDDKRIGHRFLSGRRSRTVHSY
jgi:Rps23 Pro-64 3,4-dihydroxylase Tpa1-like proline 4-hydroxylase